MNDTLTMRIGSNLPLIMLETAQTNIAKGKINDAEKLYIEGLHGFTREYMIGLLQNKYVLVVNEDTQEMSLSDDPELIKNNAKNIFDWDGILFDKLNNIEVIKAYISDISDEFNHITAAEITDFGIYEHGKKTNTLDVCHMCAKIINGNGLCWKTGGDGPIWEKLVTSKVEDGTITDNIVVYWYITEYIKNIQTLTEDVVKFCNIYNYLYKHNLCNRIKYLADKLENVFINIDKFFDTSKGYYHPLCNVEIYSLKESLMDRLMRCPQGNEFEKYGILKRNIEDEYVTAWLSPEGDFYANDGSAGALGHMVMADQIYEWTASPIRNLMDSDGVVRFGSTSPERWLEKHGWMKIHGNECHGTYSPVMVDEGWLPEPTKIQIKMVCDYIDNHFNGKLYTEPQILRRTDPVSTYKLRQMDKFKLRELFEI
jgi:hypothetical protein